MINWGLIGCGDISRMRVAPGIQAQQDSFLLAAMSPFQKELDDFLKMFSVPHGYLSIDEMLKNDEIDAVYVATPIFLHFEPALAALKAGKHVLVEKPMAMTDEQCQQLIAQAECNNVKLGVSYFRRFFPKISEIKRLIESGEIGQVVQVRISFHSQYNPAPDDPKRWRVEKKKSGGGPLWDIGCHKLDLLVELFGVPTSVFAFMDTQTFDYDVEDSCSMLLKLQNGAHCIATFNWNSKIWADEFVILGTEGRILLSPSDDATIVLERPPHVIAEWKEITTV